MPWIDREWGGCADFGLLRVSQQPAGLYMYANEAASKARGGQIQAAPMSRSFLVRKAGPSGMSAGKGRRAASMSHLPAK